MMYHTARRLAIACGVAAMLSASATDTQACWLTDLFHCHKDRCDPCAQQTTYRPFFSFFRGGSCCNTCQPQPQTCNYVPQTCYRTECVNVPVTTCRPVTTCDPCTGCPVTVMRPTTTYVRQVRRVPFTTYRAVPAPAPSCCAAPAAAAYAPAPGCSTCNAGGAPAYAAPAPAYTAPALPSTPAPYIPENSEAVPQTYEQSATVTPQTFHQEATEQEATEPQLPQRRIPDAVEAETGAPRINTRLRRERGDRWTHSTPARSRWFQPVVARTVAKVQQPVMPANYVAPVTEQPLDDAGWAPAAK